MLVDEERRFFNNKQESSRDIVVIARARESDNWGTLRTSTEQRVFPRISSETGRVPTWGTPDSQLPTNERLAEARYNFISQAVLLFQPQVGGSHVQC